MLALHSFVIEVATALGLVKFPMNTLQEKISAEVRAFELLAAVIEQSCEWFVRMNDRKQVVIHTWDDDPRLMIDPCATVERYYKDANEHLVNYMFHGSQMIAPCVVIANDAPTCAVIDSVISLVLLADAGWPAKQTPNTLAMMRRNLRDSIRNVPHGSTVTEEDYERLKIIDELVANNAYQDALEAIGEHSRQCYTCKGWTDEEVQVHIEPYLIRIPTEEINAYLTSPNDPNDSRFIADVGLQ